MGHLKNCARYKEKVCCDPGGEEGPAEAENRQLGVSLTFRLCDEQAGGGFNPGLRFGRVRAVGANGSRACRGLARG